MSFECGIIGLPNVGKSTIFNALSSGKAQAENFPFCTIEPNTGSVAVPDPRVQKLAELAESEKVIPARVTFVDIAGLIRGASKGEGLGNQFLGHIRSVDAVAHVVRCFEDENVVHVDGSLDPLRDVETIDTELLLADLDSIQKQLEKAKKDAKSPDKEKKANYEVLDQLEKHLADGAPARLYDQEKLNEKGREVFHTLLTAKPMLFVANVTEEQAGYTAENHPSEAVQKLVEYAKSVHSLCVVISGKVESEIAELDKEERSEYLKELGLETSGLDRLIVSGYQLLNLLTFFTAGPKETRAWTAPKESTAPVCAGKIHTDFERGFITAEVIAYNDYINCSGETGAKEAGKLRIEGKEYIMQDGDVVHFRFKV